MNLGNEYHHDHTTAKSIPRPSPKELRRAALIAAGEALDAEDLRVILTALGISMDEAM